MTELIEPPVPATGHAGGDIASEELVGHGHFRTHFDEPSLDYDAADVTITDETRAELVEIAARYPQARSALPVRLARLERQVPLARMVRRAR